MEYIVDGIKIIVEGDWICVNFLDTFFRTILFDRI